MAARHALAHPARSARNAKAWFLAEKHFSPVRQQQVGELEVAVDDPAGVQEGDGAQQLLQQCFDLADLEAHAAHVQQPRQVVRAVLEHQEHAAENWGTLKAVDTRPESLWSRTEHPSQVVRADPGLQEHGVDNAPGRGCSLLWNVVDP